jgi:hypothetical protein
MNKQMETIQQTFEQLRFGRFTSSQIYRLMKQGREKNSEFSKTEGIPYIQEKYLEKLIGATLVTDTDSQETNWGSLCEKHVFENILSEQYELLGDVTFLHPELGHIWSGSPDAFKHEAEDKKKLVELKCPYTRKSFATFSLPEILGLTGIEAIRHIRNNHKDGEKYYWQMVSNACITGIDVIEFIVYMPFRNEIEKIKEMLYSMDEEDKSRYYRFWMSEAEKLPHLPDESKLNNVIMIEFTVPQEDKLMLNEKVIKAGELLDKGIELFR